jgi:meso-butanediol dehydrogenase/(S,S)-butanediol dehydrogenase/diacetyl reductase
MGSNQRFTDKVALVTGAGSGIGRATAIRLAQEGAAVYMADIDGDALEETVGLLPEGSQYRCGTLDVSDRAACKQLVADTVAEFGRLHVLCNIAGIATCEHFTDISEETWNKVIGVNLNGVFFLSQAAMPHLVESRGNIINMSSSAGRTGQAYNAAYCSAKAGVLMMSKALAVEFASKGVRVNAICPGAVSTSLSQNFQAPEDADTNLFMRLMPLLPMAEAEEIAAAVAYLASDEARFVTGVEFAIDGGQTAG